MHHVMALLSNYVNLFILFKILFIHVCENV